MSEDKTSLQIAKNLDANPAAMSEADAFGFKTSKTPAAGSGEATQLLTNGNSLISNASEKPFPKSIFFIVGNEFCERFSYFGMRAILILYLIDWLKFDKDLATVIFHCFIILCYFMPLFGAILADGYLNKYRTILYLSLVYASGNVIMTFTAFPPPFWIGPLIGLFLISVGTGGIKPCVNAFGGDQFSADQGKQRSQFFSVFYFTINLGSFFSIILTPLIRENTHCFNSSCYPIAFAVPAILMIISLSLFFFGRNTYRIYPPTGSVIKDFFCCIGRALRNQCKLKSDSKEHWLDYADDHYSAEFIFDVRCVLKIFVLFIPLPVFWALFDQQGSRWTLQSIMLDRKVANGWHILPDQIQAINPVLILIFIPIFDFVVYPALDKCRIPNRPLQRMVCGMFFAAVAFVVAGFLQVTIERSLFFAKPSVSESSIDVINLSPCSLNMTTSWNANSVLDSKMQTEKIIVDSVNHSLFIIPSPGDVSCPLSFASSTWQNIELTSEGGYHLFILRHLDHLDSKLVKHPLERPVTGGSLVGVFFAEDFVTQPKFLTLQHASSLDYYYFQLEDFDVTSYELIPPGSYHVTVMYNSTLSIDLDDFDCLDGAIYTLVMYLFDGKPENPVIHALLECPPTSVSIWLQLPQYVLLTIGEVLFSVTGLSFSYSQAPESMKSVTQAGWLLTTAFGNLIDVFVAGVKMSSQAVEFFFFAILMGITTVIFATMTYFYKYVDAGHSDLDLQTDDNQELMSSAAPSAVDPIRDNDQKS